MPLLLLIFIVVPLAEIAVFIKVGELIGLGPTIAVVIITAIIGTALLRAQGLSTMERAQKTLGEGRIPMDSVIDGVSLLTAGAFLLTPGMITDTLGFLLFVPPFRHWLVKSIFKRVLAHAEIKVDPFGGPPPDDFRNPRSGFDPHPPRDGKGPVIDAEFEHIDPGDSDPSNHKK